MRGQSEWESGDDGNDQDDDGERVIVPDVSSAATLSLLGKMTSNAYLAPDEHAQWYDLADDGQDGRSWNASASFGWDEDGVRGHVFKSHDDAVVVVAIKGTSASFVAASSGQAVDDDVLGMFGGTAHNDKLNDNLLFSCCCARVDWTWSTVCPCYTGSSYTCTQSCLEQSLAARDAYYSRATAVYDAVARLYPHAQIWLVGHSLGGALAALLAHTYAVPAVAFEAPGDVLPAKRLHVPLPRASSDVSPQQLVTHVYHTADPIAMGVCTGTLSLCGAAGFALESKCHTGQLVVFDTVDKLGWAVDLRTHRINAVIEHLLRDDWEDPQPQQPPDSTATASIAASTASSVDKRAIERTALRLWGWWPGGGGGGSDDEKGGGGGDDKDKKKRKGGMPPAKLEDPDCVDCFRWEVSSLFACPSALDSNADRCKHLLTVHLSLAEPPHEYTRFSCCTVCSKPLIHVALPCSRRMIT